MQEWLKQVVVGEHFCPFAGKPLEENRVLFRLVNGGPDTILNEMLRCLDEMASANRYETALLIIEDGCETLVEYLDVFYEAEQLCNLKHGDTFSLASFHPAHRFAGEPPSSLTNALQRSPYPLLHVLREASLDAIRAVYDDDTSPITTRNTLRAEELGWSFFRRYGASTET